MALVINATDEVINIKLCGNWFAFKPKQEKRMNEDLARFVQTEKKGYGLAVLPEDFTEEESYDLTDAQKEEKRIQNKGSKESACEAALNEYIGRLRSLIANNQVSLRRDLEQANIKANPALFVAPGELDAMRLVEKYQRAHDDVAANRVEEVERLVAKTTVK